MAFPWRGDVKLATQFVDEHNMIFKRDVNMTLDRDHDIASYGVLSLRMYLSQPVAAEKSY